MTRAAPAAPLAPPAGEAAKAARTAAALAARLEALAPPRLGVAVSGGGDSMALLVACADWAARRPDAVLRAVTFDHRLRPEAAEEARAAAALCARLGVPHETLAWAEGPGPGNLAAAARNARAAALAAWAAGHGLGAVALGHTLDDQAETVLMRLARGSGADGLSAMREVSRRAGMLWLRPALGLRREALRALLRARGEGWREDPSNDDPARDRVRARRALAALADLGLRAEGLAETAGRLASEADLLRGLAAELIAAAARLGGAGELILERAAWRAAAPELRRRALARLLRALADAEHPPRHAALAALDAALSGPDPMRARTLHGCVIAADAAAIRLWREPAAAARAAPADPRDGVWDGRWRFGRPDGPAPRGLAPGPLGEAGLRELARLAEAGAWQAPAAWRASPRGARAASPALWRGGALEAAPLAGFGAARAEDLLAERIFAKLPAGAPDGHGRAR